MLWFEFSTSNNELEYDELIGGLQLAIKMGCEHIRAFIDSMIVSNQTNGLYEVRSENLMQYAIIAKALIKQFKNYKLQHTPR